MGASIKNKKILICGLPGAGKTTLAYALAPKLRAVIFNADAIRAHVNKDLGYSMGDRIEQARRMGWLCDQVVKAGHVAIADFVYPTDDTREAFGACFIVWIDRIKEGRFEDTNKLFVAPHVCNVRVTPDHSPDFWAEQVKTSLAAYNDLP